MIMAKSEEIFKKLKTSPFGLTEKEAELRLTKYGFNEIAVKKISSASIFLRQFKNSFIYLLFVAGLISLFLKEFIDAAIIFIILFINTFLGFLQEYKAEKTLEKLKKFIELNVKVKRENNYKVIKQRFLVPGDVVILNEGDLVPADLILFKSENLMVDEEILTGESFPIEKSQEEGKNLVFLGTYIVKGYGEGVVVATGKETTFGKIAKISVETVKKSIFEENLLKLSKLISKIVIITLLIVFGLNLIVKGLSIEIPKLLLFFVALAISVVPEALPLITTLTFSKSALSFAKKKILIKRLSSIEDLGNIEIICTDKTGTLTKNVLEVKNCFSLDKEKCLLFSLLASDFFTGRKTISFDPFDLAIWQISSEKIKEEIKKYGKIWERPFSPEKRTNAVIVEKNEKRFLIVRGALEEILSLSNKPFNYQEIIDQYQKAGYLAQRTLAVGFKEIEKKEFYSETDEKNLNYLGFIAFADSLKPTAKATIQEAKKLNIQIKILTGDSKEVAETLAKEIGIEIGGRVFIGEELEKMDEKRFLEVIEKNNVFARLTPRQKYKIVENLERKYDVAFLGEGINDAPSLKLASVGIVVDSGADVSKEVGDIILLKNDLKIIVDGIREGRKIFTNITKYIRYTLIANFGNFYSMAIISLLLPFLPMLATQILLVNLLTDFPLITVSTDNVDEREIKRPQKYDLKEITFSCIFLALLSSIFDITFFAIFFKTGPEMLRTLWFICSILTELVLIFSIRTKFFFLKGKGPSLSLIFVSLLAAFLTFIIPFTNFGKLFHFVVPSLSSVLTIIFLVLGYFILTEIVKLTYYRYHYE